MPNENENKIEEEYEIVLSENCNICGRRIHYAKAFDGRIAIAVCKGGEGTKHKGPQRFELFPPFPEKDDEDE